MSEERRNNPDRALPGGDFSRCFETVFIVRTGTRQNAGRGGRAEPGGAAQINPRIHRFGGGVHHFEDDVAAGPAGDDVKGGKALGGDVVDEFAVEVAASTSAGVTRAT